MKIKRCLTAMLVLTLVLANTAQAAWLDGYAQNVIAQTNTERIRQGLPALRMDSELMSAARIRAEEISRKFSHTRPNGKSGSSVSVAARNENIARGHGSPDRVMAAWLTSDSHRRNLLARGYGSIGVACLEVNGITHWVQLFGL